METTPKVHRHRHHRSDSRYRKNERTSNTTQATNANATTTATAAARRRRSSKEGIVAVEEGTIGENAIDATIDVVTATCLSQENERQSSSDCLEVIASTSQSSQQTVVLINGRAPEHEADIKEVTTTTTIVRTENSEEPCKNNDDTQPPHLDSPTQQTAGGSSRNSSGDAMSLRETLRHLPPTAGATHRHRRTHSPQAALEADSSFHRGILGFMDRELKQSSPTPSALSVGGGTSGGGTIRKIHSLSDPQASPAQRSTRSRNSLEKSPRRKRSKSESRRRRERKLIAAGEMEVRQANETLMRYLKQCSEMNDASLSGELEIDQSFDERRVHRKTKSQRDKRGHLISKLYTAGGLTSILKELSDDIVPAEGEEIFNPFTPVVSPTEDTPAHIDKMFLQTSSGYRPVEHYYYKHSFVGANGNARGRTGSAVTLREDGIDGTAVGGLRLSGSCSDTHCLLGAECRRNEINTNIDLACVIQRIWLLVSNICHGLLAGLALAHLLFVLSSQPIDWSMIINKINVVSEHSQKDNAAGTINDLTVEDDSNTLLLESQPSALMNDYAAFAKIYMNTFYCLAILCLVSVFDRMDTCRWNLSNASELISFRWLIIAMIYIATIILTICSDSIDEKLYYTNNANITLTQQEMFSNNILSVWSSLAVTRSIVAICGWIMIGLIPHKDLLYEYLVDLAKYQLPNN